LSRLHLPGSAPAAASVFCCAASAAIDDAHLVRTAKTYNLYDRLAERRAALEQWAEFVQSLAEGKVVPIGKGAAA
jgi:hypothetical protein